MKTHIATLLVGLIALNSPIRAQEFIPLDTTNWDIQATSYLFEHYKGKDAIYMQGGTATLKETEFLNGTIEFDMHLTERAGFPGIRFRAVNNLKMESFYVRPHQSGNPDANQYVPVINGISAWQLYYGPSYSFAYNYKFEEWTHVKLVILGKQLQVYLDHAEYPQLSANLIHEPVAGAIAFGGGGAPTHYANFVIKNDVGEIQDFTAAKRQPLNNVINEWRISDKFEEKELEDLSGLKSLISKRSWQHKIQTDEGVAANISQAEVVYDGKPGNTVFAKITINSDQDQIKKFEFGYSDRVVAVLNGEPLYQGNNKWRSRDYRYLGTIGLFDSVYLNLKKGKNELLFAVSEDFGGWLITGRFKDNKGVSVSE